MANYVIVPDWEHSAQPATYGYEACKPGHSFGPAVRELYLVHYVLSGRGTLQSRGSLWNIGPGDSFVIAPGETTTYWADDREPWEYAWIGFVCDRTPPGLEVPVVRELPVRQLFLQIRQHHAQGMQSRMFSLLHEFLWQAGRGAEPRRLQPSHYAVYARTYLDSSYMQHIRIGDIAAHLHIDRRYLTALFRKAYGVSPQQYLTALRLDKAREFLQAGCSVTEAVSMAGFSDLPNFSRLYKARFGLSPGQDRAQKA